MHLKASINRHHLIDYTATSEGDSGIPPLYGALKDAVATMTLNFKSSRERTLWRILNC